MKTVGHIPSLRSVAKRAGLGPPVRLAKRVLHLDGPRSWADLRALEPTGVSGVIVGKALYEGAFTVEEALACLRPA